MAKEGLQQEVELQKVLLTYSREAQFSILEFSALCRRSLCSLMPLT